MSNHHYRKGFFIALTLYLFAVHLANGQSAKQVFSNAGIWQDYGAPLSFKSYPEFKGRLVNVNWADIEIAPNTWDWNIFDTDINQHIIDSLPIVLLVYTGMNAPDWIFSYGVPKVIETDSDGSTNTYSPYYLDEDYNVYFKRMVTKVREHIQTLPSSVRNKIIGIQGCYGSTGDQIDYKGTVDEKYAISEAQLDSLFKVYSLYYYNEYKDVSPKIPLLSNPVYSDSVELYWLLDNCPGGWLKNGPFAKGTQLNFELDKNRWLYNVLNTPQKGQYIRSRSEVVGPQFSAGWWIKNQYKEMFAIMCANVYWGLDWPNETVEFLKNTNYDSTFSFFNKYAGQKVAATATNALCALKDALDASDSERFPASIYGAAERYNTQRYKNIYNSFIAYGAKLEDISVVTGSEYASLSASGTNDVGWKILPGNYERFLHQINANATSAGYWNIDDAHNDNMYGRFGRGFDVANNKNNLYFDLEDNFLRNAPLNGAYPVIIDITYFDSGTGSWRLFYDAQNNTNKLAATVTCTNTGTWKKRTVVLTDAYFGNKSVSGSDFYIKNAGSQNVIFSTVELSRKVQGDFGLLTTALPGFDTVCINTETTPRFFVLNGASLNGNPVQVNALNGYLFSTNSKGPFTATVSFSNYGTALNETIYVKQVTSAAGDFTGTITISGGGYGKITVKAISVVQNTSPQLDAAVSLLSCYNQKDGNIDLQPSNGKGPYKYKWTNDIQKLWTDSTEDISSLIAANYTVSVNSARGCTTSKTFAVTQPERITVSAAEDSSILCKSGSTTVTVTATGGTEPYLGTGSFLVKSGTRSYVVTDANSCKGSTSLTVASGTIAVPVKPEGIDGLSTVVKFQTNLVYSVVNANDSYIYTWTVPSGAIITSGQFTKSVTVNWGTVSGNINVKAINICDSTGYTSKKITATNGLGEESTDLMLARTLNNAINHELQLTPNPVGSIATLSLYAQNNYSCTVEITDIQGKILLKHQSILQTGTNLLQFNVSSFKPGMYLIRVSDGLNKIKTLKMIK